MHIINNTLLHLLGFQMQVVVWDVWADLVSD